MDFCYDESRTKVDSACRWRAKTDVTSSIDSSMSILYTWSVDIWCLTRFIRKLFMVFDFAINSPLGVRTPKFISISARPAKKHPGENQRRLSHNRSRSNLPFGLDVNRRKKREKSHANVIFHVCIGAPPCNLYIMNAGTTRSLANIINLWNFLSIGFHVFQLRGFKVEGSPMGNHHVIPAVALRTVGTQFNIIHAWRKFRFRSIAKACGAC